MPSAHQDENLQLSCQEAVDALLTFSPDGIEQWSDFQKMLLSRIFDELKEVFHATDSEKANYSITIYPKSDLLNSDDLYIDKNGIHAGSIFFERLSFHLLQFAHFLTDNFIWQISPPMGESPRLKDIVVLADFPIQALTFNALSLVKVGVSPTGFVPTIGTMLLEWLQDLTFSGTADPKSLQVDLSRRVMKPCNMDLLMYGRMSEEDPTLLLQAYENPDQAPYLRILFWQLLLDSTYFLLAHELAHELLGHAQIKKRPDEAQSQKQEVETDKKALHMVRQIPGFLPASLLMVFAFCAGLEEDVPPENMDHPFTNDRLLHLAEALLHESEGENFCVNVNAGMAFLTTPLCVINLRTKWEEGGIIESCDLAIHQYSDMDYNAHLLFYLERPPRNAALADGGRENAYLICQRSFQADLILRDRTHPDKVYNSCQIRLRPGGVADDMSFAYMKDRVLTRLHVRVPAPAEWWLTYPEAEAVISNVQEAEDPLEELKDGEGNFRHHLRFEVALNFDHEHYLQALPETSKKVDFFIRRMILLAARRFVELGGAPQLALAYFSWLYLSDDPLLEYTDRIDICNALLKMNQWQGLETVARQALEQADGTLLPGFHVYLAACLQERGDAQSALEHAFIEIYGVGDFGRYITFAQQAYSEIIQAPDDPVMANLRRFHQQYASAQKVVESSIEKAIKRFRKARKALQLASEQARSDFLYLREYIAEVELDICRLESTNYNVPRGLFESILLRESWFIPARIQLAQIALLEGNLDQARSIWLEARRLTPFLHHMVFNFREVLDQPNPKVKFTSRSVYDDPETKETDQE